MPFPPRMPVTVSAAVLRDDRLLFIRDITGEFSDVWTFPSGFVEEGEQPDAAAARETLEEGGIVCAIEGLVGVTTLVWRDAPMLYLVFLARHVSGEPTPDGVETNAAAFWGLDDLGRMPFDGQNAFLAERILTGQSGVLRPFSPSAWHAMYRTTYA